MLTHLNFCEPPNVNPKVALLIPTPDLKQSLLEEHYIRTLDSLGLPRDEIVAFSLPSPEKGKKKIPIGEARDYLTTHVKPILDSMGVEVIMCCNADFFKALTKRTQTEATIGCCVDTIWLEQNAFYCPNYRQLFYNPAYNTKILLALQGLTSYLKGTGSIFNTSPRDMEWRPSTPDEIATCLRKLLDVPQLTADIETYSLDIKKAGLASIAFAQSQSIAAAFTIDHNRPAPEREQIRRYLRDFFTAYHKRKGRLIWHGGTFDVKVLTWELYMANNADYDGMLRGLDRLTEFADDTRLITYLATNSCTGNRLGLKEIAFEEMGDYGIDEVSDLSTVSSNKLLTYNLNDVSATWFAWNKHRQTVKDTQEDVYQTVFRPTIKVLSAMEIVGMPMNMGQVLIAEKELDDACRTTLATLRGSAHVQAATHLVRVKAAADATAKLKKTTKTWENFLHIEFNANSRPQLQHLLYDYLKLPVLAKTKSGKPATDGDTLKALLAWVRNQATVDPQVVDILEALRAFHKADKILSSFIPAFKNCSSQREGWTYLQGSFHMGGAVSGRQSSSDPNLTNLPSTGTQYAKLIKKCFQAPPRLEEDPYGWLFVGADYFSLEDRISAKLTKDPNKLKVYTNGYDGHCLRAYSYFSAVMPDISEELHLAQDEAARATIINSIEDRYPELRQLSKGPTFALTYLGTWKTLVKQFGLSKLEAVAIEDEYHKLYAVADEWCWDQIKLAGERGYVELAFGLRLRTPLLPKVVLTCHDALPFEAYEEVKTAWNALGQSYGLLNTHCANQFMTRVWAHPKYRTWILPSCQIHDSQYYLVRNHLGCLKWFNDNLIELMQWDDLPPIRHPEVGLGGQLEVYHPSWANSTKIPNGANKREIRRILNAIS